MSFAARLIVAIDGPAGSGKSTAAKLLAQRLDYTLLDTGAIYRTLALVAREAGTSWDDEEELAELATGLDVGFAFVDGVNHVRLGARDVTSAIRTPEMGDGASRVSRHPEVRRALLDLQRRLAAAGGVVAEGRDVGTVVFPHAQAKFFLSADPEVRARRRHAELLALGHPVDFAQVLADQVERDRRDSTRAVAPLVAASDAVRIDSSALGPDGVVAEMERLVRARSEAKPIDKEAEGV
ncbi:MAG TPA: (d)CMP kinase [Polyangia bacterium]|jgi:cytidylate kinase